MGKEREMIYVAGKYTASTPEGVQANIDKAIRKGVELTREGYAPIVPHANTTGWEKVDPTLTWRDFMRVDLVHVKKADMIYMMDNWQDSKGAKVEERYARLLGKKIIYEGDIS